jgi:sister-chromatid-cohesion protein PDS5
MYFHCFPVYFCVKTLTLQDSCYNVRVTYLTKLISLLQSHKLPPRYNVIPFLTVHDPESDVKSMVFLDVSDHLLNLTTCVRLHHTFRVLSRR